MLLYCMRRDWAHEFPHRAGLVHLNHAGVAPWPARTARAVAAFATENTRHSTENVLQWKQKESELRSACRRLIHAEDAGDIALVKNTSEGLSFVAYGVPWNARDNVVFASQEFPSNRILWQSLQTRFGVEARGVDLHRAESPEDALFSQVDRHTRLISVSAVQYDDGLRMDLARISEFCRARGILFCIDAIQMLGVIPFDLTETPADFVVADGHKWLLGPEGIGLFYCNPDRRDLLHLNQFGWHMLEGPGDFEAQQWTEAKDASRFECGSLNRTGIHALHESLHMLLEIGVETIHDMVSSNISYLIDISSEKDLDIVSNTSPKRRSGILTVRRSGTDNLALFRYLLGCGILCAHRCRGIRFSPHFYTSKDDLDHALRLVCEYV